jgi:tRNA threonylcarbamoyladenosine biosynthesis protein TsaE
MKQKYALNNINKLNIKVKKPCIVFLKWDLWSWKTTLSKSIIRGCLKKEQDITSPTYTYYNTYDDIYHFDLYRLKDYDEFFAIGWEDIFDANEWLILVEWPEIIEKYYTPNILISLERTWKESERYITIEYIH